MSIILGCSRGHNSSTTLMVDGEVVFYLEEERLSRFKRDGTPLLGLLKAFEYVDHIDHLVVTHTHRHGPKCDWTGEPPGELIDIENEEISLNKLPKIPQGYLNNGVEVIIKIKAE